MSCCKIQRRAVSSEETLRIPKEKEPLSLKQAITCLVLSILFTVGAFFALLAASHIPQGFYPLLGMTIGGSMITCLFLALVIKSCPKKPIEIAEKSTQQQPSFPFPLNVEPQKQEVVSKIISESEPCPNVTPKSGSDESFQNINQITSSIGSESHSPSSSPIPGRTVKRGSPREEITVSTQNRFSVLEGQGE